jgi:hypothetical protein
MKKLLLIIMLLMCVGFTQGYLLVNDTYVCVGKVTVIGISEASLDDININECIRNNNSWVCECKDNKFNLQIETKNINNTFSFKTNYTVPSNGENVSIEDLYRYKSYDNLKAVNTEIIKSKGEVIANIKVILGSFIIILFILIYCIFLGIRWLNKDSKSKPLKVERNVQTTKETKVVNYKDEFKRILEDGKK